MRCPVCHAESRRSRRRSLVDYAAAVAGTLPWRCTACGTRFRARVVPLSSLLHAHCSICGNAALKRIEPEHVRGLFAALWRILGVPAFRCVPCRHKFFSVRPPSREVEETEELKIAS